MLLHLVIVVESKKEITNIFTAVTTTKLSRISGDTLLLPPKGDLRSAQIFVPPKNQTV